KAGARREIVPVVLVPGGGARRRQIGYPADGIDQARGILHDVALQLVALERHAIELPPQTEVKCEVRSYAPIVLKVSSVVAEDEVGDGGLAWLECVQITVEGRADLIDTAEQVVVETVKPLPVGGRDLGRLRSDIPRRCVAVVLV